MATIQEGIDELRAASSPQRTLNLGGGSYVIEKPVVLNAEDSGLVIEGGGASVRCGCALTNWADDADGLLAARMNRHFAFLHLSA